MRSHARVDALARARQAARTLPRQVRDLTRQRVRSRT